VGDGYSKLDEPLVNVIVLIDVDQRTGEAGQIAGGFRPVWVECDAIHAVLVAEIDCGAIVRPRRLQAVLAQLSGEVEVGNLLSVVPVSRTRRREVTELRWGHPARGEDIPRHALPPTDADRLTHRVGRGLEGVVDLRVVEIISITLERRHVVIRAIQIIGPAVDDIPFRADDRPDVVVLVKRSPSPAFDVAASNGDIRAVTLRARVRGVACNLRRRT